jgi:PAS domain S-box-containing protein
VGTELGRVAERKRAEDALRHSEERTRSILAAANDAFIGMDEQGVITDWNRSAELIFGWPRAEAIGRALADTIVPAGFRAAHSEGLRHFLETGEAPVLGRRIELSALHRDGHEFPAELSIWHIASGKRHLFNAFVQDISERKRTEQALAVARDQAMEASRMKSQFLATMSHEIRTPMNGVIGLAELLLDTELRPEQRPYAEGLRSAGEALLAVINDILDFSKIEAGKLELEDVAFDPRRLVEEVVALLAPTAHGKGLEIVGTCSPGIPTALRGDPSRLRQILVNLMSNAVKFTDQGEVVLRVEQVGTSTGDWMTVQFEVSDTGIGIEPGDQQHILEPFSQADASTTRRYGGTGLGLAISRQLTEAMGGAISLHSRPGEGSRFLITVPLARHWDAAPHAPASPTLAGARALVVDDNATSRDLLRSQLERWGMRAEVAGDAAAALAVLEAAAGGEDPFAVAVVDRTMPGTDGIEVVERMIERPALVGTRVLVLTTGRSLDAGTARRLGIGESVSKPVVPRELHAALVGILAGPPSVPMAPLAEPVAPPSAEGPGPAHPSDGRPSRGRILVVEDNPTNQMVAVGLLARLGFDADVVGDGRRAVEAVAHRDYAGVLMDCNMPIMDGYEATMAIRRQEGDGAHVPIVAMTAGALVGDRERCLAVGMDDYVSKPVKLGELERALSRWWPHEGPGPSSDVIDGDQLASLRALDGGDGVFLSDLLESFLTSSAQALKALAASAAAGDALALAREAHRFKGEASTLGATGVAALCAELEALPAPLDGTAAALVARVEREMERVRAVLRAELDAAQVS